MDAKVGYPKAVYKVSPVVHYERSTLGLPPYPFVVKIIGQLANLEIAEICARSGANCGSIYLDINFRELVQVMSLIRRPVLMVDSSLL